MKFEIGQKVFFADRKCMIVATKDTPHKRTSDPFGRTEVWPENDYLLMIYQDTLNNEDIFSGSVDVKEHQIDSRNW